MHVVSATALRLRQAPDVGAPVLASLPRGTLVDVLDQTNDGLWSQVKAGRRVGWLATKYLTLQSSPAAPTVPTEEFPWMPIALAELGVREFTGAGDNPRVLEYLRSTDLHPLYANQDETPWCSGFANWCVEHAGLAGTNSAGAKSWLDWGRAIQKPRRGAVTVLSRGKGHHVGFYIHKRAAQVHLLGGNQNDCVSVADYDAARVLGYRVPHR